MLLAGSKLAETGAPLVKLGELSQKSLRARYRGIVVSRPLRKHTLDGVRYCRRELVEAELVDLAATSRQELEARAAAMKSSAPGC